ncbi:MAG: type II toxin-antitoxin system PrlF family antitoxin [Gemmatimonadaceae bacterium]
MSNIDYSTLTSKGQITVPKRVREALALRTGDHVVFEQREDGSFVLVARNADVRSLRGIVKKSGPPVSLAAMDDAIQQATVGRSKR